MNQARAAQRKKEQQKAAMQRKVTLIKKKNSKVSPSDDIKPGQSHEKTPWQKARRGSKVMLVDHKSLSDVGINNFSN